MSTEPRSSGEEAEPFAPGHVPTVEMLRRARVFWQQAEADVKAAAKQHKSGAYLESAYLSFQGAINALTVVCYLHGQFRIPNYSAAKMATLCQNADARFAALEAACAALEEVQAHSPFQQPAPEEVLAHVGRSTLDAGQAVLETVRGYLKQNKRRFFSP